jgi:magnesium transporter
MTTTILTQGRVTWTNILHPTTEDIEQLAQRYPNFHPLNLEDCLTEREIPKLDHYDNYLFLVVQLPVLDPVEHIYHPAEVDIFIAKGALVTAHRGNLPPLNDLIVSLETDPQKREHLMGRGASPLLYNLLEELVNACYPLLHDVSGNLRHIERNLFSENARHLLNEIALVRREIIALKHILSPQQEVIRELEDGDWDFIHEDLDLYWDDILDHLAQLCMMLEENSELIGALSETADTLASHRIDDVVRLLTIVTVLTLPLTLVTAIFGMNIALPFSQYPHLFYVILVLGMLFFVGLMWYFRKQRWF